MKASTWNSGFANRTRVLSALVSIVVFGGASAAAQDLQAQTSIFVAYVIDSAGRPVSGADVQVMGTSLRTSSDDSGRFALLAVPPGKAILKVRRLGFAELTIPISVTPGLASENRYKMMPVAEDLKKIVVRASSLKPERYAKTGRFDAFYRRRAEGLGTFLTREDIDARNAQKSEDLLRMVTGVRIRYRGNVPFVQFLRCDQVNVYIDGIRSHDPFRDFAAMSPLEIEAMEIYHGLATVPPEFSPKPNDCGAIVIWTRWHGADK